MRIAFAIVSLFPGGGLQRDCIDIAKIVRAFGHDVVIYTARLNHAADVPVVVLHNDARTNHGWQQQFARDFEREAAGRFDLIVGFDKLTGLDVLYCADASMYYRVLKRPYLALFPRYRTYTRIERESFKREKKTKTLLLSQNQVSEYWSAWNSEPERLTLLPPTLARTRRRPEYRVNGVREKVRAQLGLPKDVWVWIAVAVQPRTKGIDRVLGALTDFPQARLLIAGLNETNRTSLRMAIRAQRLDTASRVTWLGHREDIEQLMAAADVLVHPARYDTTGTVILEAIVNGLPVVTTAACGYAMHVEAAGAGIVLKEPFDYRLFRASLDEVRERDRRSAWSAAGIAYGQTDALYEGRMRAAQIILGVAKDKQSGLAELTGEKPVE